MDYYLCYFMFYLFMNILRLLVTNTWGFRTNLRDSSKIKGHLKNSSIQGGPSIVLGFINSNLEKFLLDNHGSKACAMMNSEGKWESKSCSEFGGHICKQEAKIDPEIHATGVASNYPLIMV